MTHTFKIYPEGRSGSQSESFWSAVCDVCLWRGPHRQAIDSAHGDGVAHAAEMDMDYVFRDRTHPPKSETVAKELLRFVDQLLLFKDTRVGATLREFMRRIAWGWPNDKLRLNTATMISQGEMMRFYELTGPYPQHDSNHFTRFYDVVIRRVEREDSDRPVFGFRMTRWDWEWIGPSVEFIVRNTPTEASKRAKIRRPLEHAFQLSEARMQKNPDDKFEVTLCQMLRAEVLRRS